VNAFASIKKRSNFFVIILAPLIFLERLHGRKRLALLGTYCVLLIVIAIWAWRAMSLRGLPDIGEPFDVKTLGTISVPDGQNAFVVYREAVKRVRPADEALVRKHGKTWEETDWARANPDLKRWAEVNSAALQVWLVGTERPQALDTQPRDVKIDTNIDLVQEQRKLVPLALLEGSRREQAGDLEGAWTMYRAAVRCSRHAAMHGCAVARMIGTLLFGKTRPHVTRWIQHPAMTSVLLSRAQRDLDICAAMSPPMSQTIHVEYFGMDDALAHPENWSRWGVETPDQQALWYNHIPLLVQGRRFLRHEPERSRRLLRLFVANMLSQCDRPRSKRAKVRDASFLLYEGNGNTPPSVRGLGPERLQQWLLTSDLHALFPALGSTMNRCDGDFASFDLLRLVIALRAYGLDRGAPPTTFGDLLGPYLKTLPEGFEAGDPVDSNTEPPVTSKRTQ
jgi:hypothetical protein